MDVITAYLDSLFSPHPRTPRILRAKTELRTLMEASYRNARSAGLTEREAVGKAIADYGDLDTIAPKLGIADELSGAQPGAPAGPHAASDASADTQPIDTSDIPLPQPSGQVAAPAERTPVAGTAPAEDRGRLPAPGATPGPDPALAPPPPPSGLPVVTLDEARAFAEDARGAQRLLTVAVTLFVISPAALVSLPVAAALPGFPIGEAVASLIGFTFLAVLVCIGVGFVLRRSRLLAPHRRLVEGRFEEDHAVTDWAHRLREDEEPRRSRALLIAVACWILSPIPTIAGGLLADGGSPLPGELASIGVPVTLLMVAVGLAVFLPTAWATGVAETLEDDHDPHAVDDDTLDPPAIRILKAALWPLTLATYLAWSFLGNSWGVSWLVWPLAGIVYWALTSIADAWRGREAG